ncbi:MAG: alkaline phosphatase family protein [Deltaproteobacteria bacterium]|nr:alkaline phosphatase family protein [Deltaproteobacteria bacterium]MBN2673729.1 alkaline phosphatase family protein [Deltaproteobacteria bacterium]
MSSVSSPRLIIIGIDGGDPILIEQYLKQNRLPNIKRLIHSGLFCPLRSTIPPTTFPAWTNFMTGSTPGIHGITDFTVKQGYNIQFVGAFRRNVRTIFEYICDNGLTVGVAWFPATYPPIPLNGFHISGWDSPVSNQGDASFVHPASLHTELQRRFPDEHLRFNTINEFNDHPNWYLNAKAALLNSVSRRAEMACWLLEHQPTDVAAFYFGETDTVAHHFHAFADEKSPRRPDSVDPRLETAIAEVYERIDAAIGDIQQRAGNVPMILVSDHGVMGNADIAVYLNRFLHGHGLLQFKSAGRLSALMSRNQIRFIPARFRRNLFRAFGGIFPSWYESRLRFGRIDFNRTIAFSEEIPYAPAIWLNQAGREPKGQVRFRDRENRISDIMSALKTFTHADGTPVVQNMYRREELHEGALHLFPDIVLQFTPIQGYMPICQNSKGIPGQSLEKMNRAQLLGRKGTSMPGGHAPYGIFISNMPFYQKVPNPLHLHEVASLIYELLDIWPPEGDDMKTVPQISVSSPRQRAYTAMEQRIVAQRLKRLGYLEE